MQNRLGIFLIITILTAALMGGWLGGPLGATPPSEADTDRLLKVFSEALAAIREHYVEPIPTEELVESAVRGMLRTLDPHSSFFSTSDYNRLQEEQRGRYYGLGISIRPESPGSGRVMVTEPPVPGTPAYKVGLRAGDVISKIEGEPIDDWDLNEEVIPKLKGPKGTEVNITVERPGEPEPLELTVVRDEIPMYSIKYFFRIGDDIGYIDIDRFSETTGKELAEALEKLDEKSLKGFILDLRGNPGGALNQALAVSDRFLSNGQVIVVTKDRNGQGREFRTQQGSQYDYPMVVLIDENSASASEIVSGALQDHDRALIVGETSFGKALVQTIYPLEGNKGLALTTGRYYTPSNRLIQRDYSSSFYDYFNSRQETTQRGTETHYTDSGRTVFAGGGITPDEKVGRGSSTRLIRVIERERLFAEFVDDLTKGEIQSDIRYQFSPEERLAFTPEEREQLIAQLAITDETTRLFKTFLDSHQVDFTDQSFEESRRLIENKLKQKLFLVLLGPQESLKVSLEVDQQVLRALELLPKATALIQNNLVKQ
ncbi:MAG: S41 family peptidase [Acidobacteria bacterium]|nr:S41 family peptidase [Acidobacteriota bacterium]